MNIVDIRIFVLLCLILLMSKTYATVPNISGTYSGTLTGTENNCGTFPGGPFTNGPFPLESETIVLTISLVDANTGVFVGSGTTSNGSTISLGGQIDANGLVISGGLSAADTTAPITTGGAINGSQFSGNTLIFTFTGADTTSTSGQNICLLVTASSTLSKIGGGSNLIIIPEVTNSATITNVQTLNVQVQGITSDIGGRIGNILRGNAIGFDLNETGFMLEGQADGINAGDEIARGFGAWASYSRSEFENDFISLAFEGNRNTILAGIDFSPEQTMVAGIALGYEFSDIDTKINRGNLETDGYSLIPYFGYLITDTFSVDGSFGYSHVKTDQFRTDPGTGAIITSSPESDRLFGMVNLNGIWFRNNWVFGTNIGLLWADNYQEDFIESNGTTVDEQDTKLRQWRIGGNVAYTYNHFEPFLSLNFSRDFKMTEITVASGPQPSNDRDDFLFGAGIRYFGNDGFSGNLEYSKRLDRDNFNEDMINLNVRIEY